MTNDEMVELSKRFHDTDDLYQLRWLKEYLEARIRRVTLPKSDHIDLMIEMAMNGPCPGCKQTPAKSKCTCIPF